MQKITEHLYIGDATDLDCLGDTTAVLSCVLREEHSDEYLARRLGERRRYRIPINDGEEIPEHWIEQAVQTIEDWLQQGEKILVHCRAGVSRSPSVVIAYLMSWGKTWDEAEEIVTRARPITLPHPDVKRSVKRYFKEWPYDGGYDESR